MTIKKKRRLSFSESSAASDVAFLLIIYFIVIAGFNVNKGFLINLPAKDSTRLILREDLLRFELDEANNIIYNGDIIDIPAARRIIGAAQEANPNLAVMLSINSKTRWQQVVSFVEIAQNLRIDSFSFAMQKESQ
jgi:biopolymer transport protein ExbD